MRASSGRVHDRVAAADRCGPSGSATPRRPPHRTRARKSPQLYSTLLCPLCDSRRGPAAWCLAPRLGGSGLARARGGRRAARLSRPTRRLGRARSRSFQLSLSTYFSLYPRPAASGRTCCIGSYNAMGTTHGVWSANYNMASAWWRHKSACPDKLAFATGAAQSAAARS